MILLTLGFAALGTPAPLTQSAQAAPGTTDANNVTELMYRFLYRLYELLGGDPADLVMASLDQAAAAVTARYEQHGIPELSPEETIELLFLLEQFLLGNRLPPPGMSLESWMKLNQTAASMWVDLTT